MSRIASKDLVRAAAQSLTKNEGRGGRRSGAGHPPWQPERKPVAVGNGTYRQETQAEAWERVRAEVRNYAIGGFAQEIICKVIHPPCCDDTLRKTFKDELEHGATVAKGRIIGVAYILAASGRYPDMTRFFLRAQCGWRDRGEVQRNDAEVIRFKLIEGDDW